MMGAIITLLTKLWDKASKGMKAALLLIAFIMALIFTGWQMQAASHQVKTEWKEYQDIKARVTTMPSAAELKDVVEATKQIAPNLKATIEIKQHLKIPLNKREKKFMKQWDEDWDGQ